MVLTVRLPVVVNGNNPVGRRLELDGRHMAKPSSVVLAGFYQMSRLLSESSAGFAECLRTMRE